MTSPQNAFFTMVDDTTLTCMNYHSVWAENADFKTTIEKLQTEVLNVLPVVLAQQEQKSTGITIDKNRARRTLSDQVLSIANLMEAYAITIKNNSIRANVRLVESEMAAFTDRALIGEATLMASIATDNMAQLGPYQITTATVTTLKLATNDFSSWLGKPKVAINSRKLATKKLVALVALAKVLLEALDAQTVLFKVSDPEFYEQYWNARKIVNVPKQHRAISFAICDADNKPVENVTIVVPALQVKKCTGPSGKCFIQHAPAGNYDVKATKNGYTPSNMHISVNDSEGTNVEIVMRKD